MGVAGNRSEEHVHHVQHDDAAGHGPDAGQLLGICRRKDDVGITGQGVVTDRGDGDGGHASLLGDLARFRKPIGHARTGKQERHVLLRSRCEPDQHPVDVGGKEGGVANPSELDFGVHGDKTAVAHAVSQDLTGSNEFLDGEAEGVEVQYLQRFLETADAVVGHHRADGRDIHVRIDPARESGGLFFQGDLRIQGGEELLVSGKAQFLAKPDHGAFARRATGRDFRTGSPRYVADMGDEIGGDPLALRGKGGIDLLQMHDGGNGHAHLYKTSFNHYMDMCQLVQQFRIYLKK